MSENNKAVETVKFSTAFIPELLIKANELGASDIQVVQGQYPNFSIDGDLLEIRDLDLWTSNHIQAFLLRLNLWESFTTPTARGTLPKSLDSSFTLRGKRYRLHCARNTQGIALFMRVIPMEIPKFETLNLPDALLSLVKKKTGLILVTGPTGSGKSTTLASFIDNVNSTPGRREIIVTIERPVEFVYPNNHAYIIQREVGRDVDSFEDAVDDAVRENIDIMLIGELQTREAIRNAITLAETGHLVMGSLHTNGAAETFDRIADAFPGDQQAHVRTQLSNSLQGIIHQNLIPKLGGGRVPLTEAILFNDESTRNKVREASDVASIRSYLNDANNSPTIKKSFISKLDSVAVLLHKNLITMDTAVNVTGLSEDDIVRAMNKIPKSNL